MVETVKNRHTAFEIYYLLCSNDDPSLTLGCFTQVSDLGPHGLLVCRLITCGLVVAQCLRCPALECSSKMGFNAPSKTMSNLVGISVESLNRKTGEA